MTQTIEYKSEIIIDTLKNKVCEILGTQAWDALVDGIGAPDIVKEPTCGCKNMREFMRRFDAMTDVTTAKAILTKVRHGLQHSQFESAKERFVKCGSNIDAYLEYAHAQSANNFTRLRDTGEDFYGQSITSEVLNFLLKQPGLISDVRKGAELYVTAIPFDMVNYLKETTERKKRYYACHCPFARESILIDGGEVSKTMCYCSLGHAKVAWEAIFDIELDGEVLESALGGDLMCKYVIHLPNEVVEKYT